MEMDIGQLVLTFGICFYSISLDPIISIFYCSLVWWSDERTFI